MRPKQQASSANTHQSSALPPYFVSVFHSHNITPISIHNLFLSPPAPLDLPLLFFLMPSDLISKLPWVWGVRQPSRGCFQWCLKRKQPRTALAYTICICYNLRMISNFLVTIQFTFYRTVSMQNDCTSQFFVKCWIIYSRSEGCTALSQEVLKPHLLFLSTVLLKYSDILY